MRILVVPAVTGVVTSTLPKYSDPAIDVEAPTTDDLICGDTVTYTATISNTTQAQVTAEDVVATIDVPFGHTISNVQVTVENGDTMSCQVLIALPS